MIPMVLARHIQSGLADYVETTFPMTNKPFRGSVRALAHQAGALTQEPFVSVKLPFRVAGKHEEFPFSECLHPAYRPYAHQMRAFQRIAAGQSTLVATGTGSGKTECFLYPILDYCYRQRRLGKNGIKAVLVYPMNALATDQAKRLAELIYTSPDLRGNVTAGMYVGRSSQGGANENHAMTATNIVTSHDELLKTPPDILLTNYKMLDYLLVRPEDSQLWKNNEADTLKYFVVDELHTFDGAQGTDLACLLRRLTDRLHTDPKHMCFVGTSATMGTKETARDVCRYAGQIFNTTFTPDSVIAEDRLKPSEFFDTHDVDDTVPTPAQANELIRLERELNPNDYLIQAAKAWLDTPTNTLIDSAKARIELADRLKRSRFLAALANLIADAPRQIDRALLDELAIRDARFNTLNDRQQRACVDALVALVSHSRTGSAEHSRPFLNVQIQLWAKEWARVVATIASLDGAVMYSPVMELDAEELKHRMPVLNCRDCGGTAWIGLAGKDGKIDMGDPDQFYATYFNYRPDSELVTLQPCDTDFEPTRNGGGIEWYCNVCMQGQIVARFDETERECPSCGTERIPMAVRSLELVSENRKHYRCPFCGSEQDLAMVGVRATTQISVMLSQLNGDAFNDDDKTIVFSDSVQDASYRASWFNARTWRFALRSSDMDYIREERKDGATLADYLNNQNAYFKRRYPDEAKYIIRFIAPNMTWMREYEAVINGNPAGPGRQQLVNWIGNRLRLESLLEFGLRSRRGRTLEKSGCATIAFDQRKLETVSDIVAERCHNEAGMSEEAIHGGDWLHLVAAFLDLLRVNGAFFDVTYDQFLNNDGNKYLLSNKNVRWMPGMYAEGMPRFLSDKPPVRKGVFDTVDSPAYRALVDRYLSDRAFEGEIQRDVLSIILSECVDAGFVTQQHYSSGMVGRTVYGLNENGCTVSTNVSQFICDQCGRSYSYAAGNIAAWSGARCRTRRCPGRLVTGTAETDALELRYYGELYRAEPSERIHAAEHTGLLNGEDRAKLEQQFKSDERKPGDVNVLACTPTLEMGIDIGDLSTVILSSIPPSQAQYIQRAGRAGRRDGNSLVLAVANGKQHDLYFYQRPTDMLAGTVEPPHIFLEATAVLERQITAYALDHWVHDMLDSGAAAHMVIPKKLKECLNNVSSHNPNGFPNNFLMYAEQRSGKLLDGFSALFDFNDEIRAQLDTFTHGAKNGSNLARRIYDVFEKTIDTLTALKEQRDDIERLMGELKSQPADSSYEAQQRECADELHSLNRIIGSINDTNTFNYLSDEGVLPNYAFPETGVTLHTILKANKDNGETNGVKTNASRRQQRRETSTRDFVRPAASAITELAPGNTFFAGGRKYEINRVLCAKGGFGDEAATWRLCPNCSHAEPASQTEHLASCPSCGSLQWADSGQKRPMLRINTVISEETYSESLVDDSSDSRPNTRFVKNAFVDVNETEVEHAWRTKGVTDFGFEYIPQGIIREINFGQAGADGPQIEVAGNSQIRTGFKVCLKCGALADKNGRIRHAYSCPERREGVTNPQSETCLFLYREVQSEILRLLVPGIDTGNAEGCVAESFTAAVMLGMKQQFGNVDHLGVASSNEPVSDGSGLRKTYLVIYDTVPGGTGYLKQLGADKQTMFEVLGKAKEVMESCDCASTDADGCYRCLYAYRQSRDLGKISRRQALDIVDQILDPSNTTARIDTVSHISVNKLFDSTLEQQFVEALRRIYAHPLATTDADKGRRAIVKDELVNFKPGNTVTINGYTWDIEPQVTLGPADGVAVYCKPDFVLRLAQTTADNVGDKRRNVAVFTDGLQYHAGIQADDTLKREALRRAGYRVWTLTYDDVIGYVQGKNGKDLAESALNVSTLPSAIVYRKTVEKDKTSDFDPSVISAVDALAYYLAEPDAERIFHSQALAFSFAMNRVKRKDAEAEHELAQVEQALRGSATSYMNSSHLVIGKDGLLNAYLGLCIGDDMRTTKPHVGLLFDDSQASCASADSSEDPLAGWSDEDKDRFKRQWAGFWHMNNILQFSPYFTYAIVSALSDDTAYEPLRLNAETMHITQNDDDPAWAHILSDSSYSYLSDEARTTIGRCIEYHVPAPMELGCELLDEHDEIVADAEFGWADRKIVFFPSTEIMDNESVAEFERRGWAIITEHTDDLANLFSVTTAGKDA